MDAWLEPKVEIWTCVVSGLLLPLAVKAGEPKVHSE